MKSVCWIPAGLVLLAATAIGGEPAPRGELFPFSLPTEEPTEGVTDLSFLNAKPADEPVTVREGRFFAGQKPVRLWGVIIIGGCCFPEHGDAATLARRLAGMGLNLVRIHLIDGHYAPNGLLDPDGKGQLRILPAQLEKLDYLVAQLKKCGIYVELPVNGYHWRNIIGQSLYADLEPTKFAPFASGVPLWNEKYLAIEKQFARDFLAHVNPYTGKPYTQEPCVATVEIVNENGLICAWRGGHVRKAWPESMKAEFQNAWNRFLVARYSTTDRLRQAWAVGAERSDPREMLRNGDFRDPSAAWRFQLVSPSTATLRPVADGGPSGGAAVMLDSQRAAKPLAFVILQQPGLTIEKGCRYRLSFLAKADVKPDSPAKLQVGVSMDHAPWRSVGLARQAEVTGAWHEVKMIFEGDADEPAAKLMVAPPVGASRVWLTGFSLRRADRVGLLPGESLEAAKVAMLSAPDDTLERTPAVGADCVDFLYEIDRRYFLAMRDFLRDELGCRHPIKGTQVDQYSSYFSQSQCDFVDAHGYWQHPAFPRKPWDPKDWTIGNSPMVDHGGQVVVHLAGCRVQGKPYNVSEYCHPAPSTFCAEEVPTVAAFGALQDWDGITFHCWHEWAYDWRVRAMKRLPADRLDSFFNHARHPVKRVTMPFGALAFRRGDVAPARTQAAVGVTLADEQRTLVDRGTPWQPAPLAKSKGATWLDAFTHGLCLKLGADNLPAWVPPTLKAARSDTGQLVYDQSAPAGGLLTVNAPRAKAVIGFGAGKTLALDDVILRPGPTMQNGFSVITASAVRGEDFHSPGAAILVTATGYVENQDMGWNADKTSVGNQWGQGPVVCEGVPFELTLKASRATAWALDACGRRGAAIQGKAGPEGLRFTFGPAHKTLWYELRVLP